MAGALVVLMREQGLHFTDGLSILVSSTVPEGKGVSSSAAVEVATMQALAAAHGLQLDGRQLALLCQKVGLYHAMLISGRNRETLSPDDAKSRHSMFLACICREDCFTSVNKSLQFLTPHLIYLF